jgi:uncharacterized protein (TIGR02271 family)
MWPGRPADVVRPFRVPGGSAHLKAQFDIGLGATVGSRNDADRTSAEAGETVVPLLAEEIAVSKQTVETGRVQVARITHEREHLIDELLSRQTAEIERVPVGQHVETMPAVREDGDTIVIPIVEEVLVIEHRLFLKEEVRVRRVSSTDRHRESVMLRHHEAIVTRLPAETPATGEATETGEPVQQPKQEG